MTARAPAILLVAAVAGVLARSGMAGLAAAPPNDACLTISDLPEGSPYGGSLELWPLGLRCGTDFVDGAATGSEFLGPTMAQLYAWIAVAALLAAVALLRRESAFARGAFAEVLVLALLGVTGQGAGMAFALMACVLVALPLALLVEHRLRPARASGTSRCGWPLRSPRSDTARSTGCSSCPCRPSRLPCWQVAS